MALTSRISLHGPPASDPEDFFGSSLGVIFPDDVMNQHGDAEHSLLYTSPHLPRPLHIALADPDREADRKLFSHYLWNASLLLAEFVEAGALHLPLDLGNGGSGSAGAGAGPHDGGATTTITPITPAHFDVKGLTCLELGAGTALPSLMAALLGAADVVVSDYPSPAVLDTLRKNVAVNTVPECSPSGTTTPLTVEGHAWGELDTPFAAQHRGHFDRLFVCDCLWMPWQHDNLRRSIAWFLKDSSSSPSPSPSTSGAKGEAKAWVIAGFHTGREKMRGFFEDAALASAGLEVERIWERDCDGVERAWVWDRGHEDVTERKRWLVVGVLRRQR
ncbi:uncharacterized protein GGS25DRAFT_490533 [Hypoxylon fragiforme]|uniref:uncharacterized protein n=1 Tax=Hypoxylon fragiforme TaxID=63214 RepID=UPI0020C6B90B|nr:uncharacterized protein GGS25DRAFT_490533 [Hypoxylon fragiforme]KAI2608495.1 hypothetical protein GGS25DRAFT_490533 [Hypoxylon fragiforme]